MRREQRRERVRSCASALVVALASSLCATAVLAKDEVPTRDIESPARSAFMARVQITMLAGFRSLRGIPLFDVPAGRRAVIEQMSARCDVRPGNPVLEVFVEVSLNAHEGNAGTLRFQIPVLSQGTEVVPEVEFFIGSLATRVYADRRDADGGGVTGGAARASNVGSGDCEIQISGHTIAL